MQDVKKEMTKRRIYTVLGNLLYTGIYEHFNWVPSRNLLVCTEFDVISLQARPLVLSTLVFCQLMSPTLAGC